MVGVAGHLGEGSGLQTVTFVCASVHTFTTLPLKPHHPLALFPPWPYPIPPGPSPLGHLSSPLATEKFLEVSQFALLVYPPPSVDPKFKGCKTVQNAPI